MARNYATRNDVTPTSMIIRNDSTGHLNTVMGHASVIPARVNGQVPAPREVAITSTRPFSSPVT